tara:strand:- start:161 stop:550 length:390 start_codon:yes stop_codon:yes gene_type:complete
MIEERIRGLLKERKWTFVDFQNMQGIIDEFNLKLQDTMTKLEKLDFIFNKSIYTEESNTIPDRWEFQDIFSRTVSEHLDVTIAIVLKEELMNANINFNKEEVKTNVSKRSVGRKSHKKRTTNAKTDSEE